MEKEHIKTVHAEDDDIGYSIYKVGDDHEIWVRFGVSVFPMGFDDLDNIEEMLRLLRIDMEEYYG